MDAVTHDGAGALRAGRLARWMTGMALLLAMPLLAAEPVALKPCRLKGVEHEAWCGVLQRALDPTQPQGPQIDLHYAVLPALARRKAPDPVFFFAGGPGQSAIELAGPLSKRFARFGNRRDMVFVDQRGTGRSAPLKCRDDDERAPPRPLAEMLDEGWQLQRLQACRQALQKLPHGDLRQYTTTIAMADIDAVRQALGVAQINAIGASYGTRAVLEYMRQFPKQLRRAVLDGVAPADMVLPAAFSTDNQAALDALFDACANEPACRQRHATLRAQWQQLLAGLPRELLLQHPLTGQPERVTLSRTMLLGAVRGPLYSPALAAGLPAALAEAAQGRFEALIGLASGLGGGGGLSTGMHFSVVCAEDVPRLAQAADAAGPDFGDSFAALYRNVCAEWPRGTPPAVFYTLPPASVPTLIVSGSADPATPPRHGARVARALGPQARHVVVPNAGHGVLQLACLRESVQRFVDADDGEQALKVDADCAAALPRPPAFVPVNPIAASAGAAR
ncbi:alpha/beta hydrolase [Aquabacterium sp.]|uniref:alpha/beta hydrolase n=1 Tax=Aquabacterium sp. TaxID=1872578 RepID=UPI002CD370FF|nr:alpha/beta hydrolase [Aquabacterium sp.]HSW08843.1 alpha/beta hydrolase [Aquabacterium sp.]